MNKRFHTYIGQEMYDRLLQYPYMKGSDFLSCPTEPNTSSRYCRLQDHLFIDSFLCMIFYVYSDCSMNFLEPTGNCIKGIIHRNGPGMVRECFPQGYIVRNEQIAYKLNHRKRDSKPTTTKAKKRPNQKRKSSK